MARVQAEADAAQRPTSVSIWDNSKPNAVRMPKTVSIPTRPPIGRYSTMPSRPESRSTVFVDSRVVDICDHLERHIVSVPERLVL